MARRKIVLKPNGKLPSYTVQATVWKDKKTSRISSQPHLVKDTEDRFVRQWSKEKKRRQAISSHEVITPTTHMNGVDHKDHDTVDWTVSLKSNRFYLRIF